jgi:hypothetical protein
MKRQKIWQKHLPLYAYLEIIEGIDISWQGPLMADFWRHMRYLR